MRSNTEIENRFGSKLLTKIITDFLLSYATLEQQYKFSTCVLYYNMLATVANFDHVFADVANVSVVAFKWTLVDEANMHGLN
jgi:hypothetical protein